MTKQAVMHHYKTKEQLRLAVFDEMDRRWQQKLPELVMAASAGGGLEKAMEAFWGALSSEPLVLRMVVRELLDRPEDVQEWLRRTYLPWMKMAARQLGEEGILGPDTDVEAHFSVVGSLILSVIGIPPIQALGEDGEGEWGARLREAAIAMIRRSSGI